MTSCSKRITRLGGTGSHQSGLTLFELLIVLTIIAFLSTLVAPRVIGYLGRAKSDTAKAQLANIATALELYAVDVGAYPDENSGLSALITPSNDLQGWFGPYLKDADGLKDPWGFDYQYQVDQNGLTFVVRTLGKDGRPGGDGENADLEKR